MLGQLRRQLVAFAGDAHDAHAIDKPATQLHDPGGTFRRRSRRHQQDQLHIALATECCEIVRLVGNQVGHNQSAQAGFFRRRHERLSPASMDQRVRHHADDRRREAGLGCDRANGREEVGNLEAVVQCTSIGRLNYRPIGNGVAERKAEFDQVGPCGRDLRQQRARRGDIGIARRQKRHEGFATLGPQASE